MRIQAGVFLSASGFTQNDTLREALKPDCDLFLLNNVKIQMFPVSCETSLMMCGSFRFCPIKTRSQIGFSTMDSFTLDRHLSAAEFLCIFVHVSSLNDTFNPFSH